MLDKLIQRLQNELYSKNTPGELLLDLKEKWLDNFLTRYKCDIEALTLGFILADYKLQESILLKKQNEHIRMAVDYAKQIFEKYEVSEDKSETILEILETHHGGKQKHIESKLFMNADAMAFLEPKGWMHLFGSYYTNQGAYSFSEALDKTIEKVEEKKRLINLDEETLAEAEKLYDTFNKIIKKINE